MKMREILFKAKRKDNGEWVEGSLIIKKQLCYIHPNSEYFMFDSGKGSRCMHYTVVYEVEPSTLCQYTGLTAYWMAFENEPQECDVWEHDLLEVDYNGKKVIAEVKFEGGMYILTSNEFADSYIPLFEVTQVEDVYWVDAKVIGNIFDNPELIGGDTK